MMSNIAGILRKVKFLKDIEVATATLYDAFYRQFEITDPEASKFFYKLHLEEKKHSRIADHLETLVKNNQKAFRDIIDVEVNVDDMKLLDKLEAMIKTSSSFTVEQALIAALDLETIVGEAESIVKISEALPEFERLIRKLYGDPHIDEVYGFMKRRGLKD